MLEYQYDKLKIPRTLLYKCPLHSKSGIDGHHAFPRISAEKANKHNLGLTLETLVECCEADEQYEQIQREKKHRKFKRIFRVIPQEHEVMIPEKTSQKHSFNIMMQRMIYVSTSTNKILLSPILCTCEMCLIGKYDSCLVDNDLPINILDFPTSMVTRSQKEDENNETKEENSDGNSLDFKLDFKYDFKKVEQKTENLVEIDSNESDGSDESSSSVSDAGFLQLKFIFRSEDIKKLQKRTKLVEGDPQRINENDNILSQGVYYENAIVDTYLATIRNYASANNMHNVSCILSTELNGIHGRMMDHPERNRTMKEAFVEVCLQSGNVNFTPSRTASNVYLGASIIFMPIFSTRSMCRQNRIRPNSDDKNGHWATLGKIKNFFKFIKITFN